MNGQLTTRKSWERRRFLGLLTAFVGRLPSRAQNASPQTSAANPDPANFAIAGVVVNAVSNTPIAKALVQIALATDRSRTRAVVTGPDGHFSFTNLPANKFTLTVTRSSGRPQAYLANGNLSSAVVTGPDQQTANLVFPFHTPGTLTGAIIDESNEPVRNATVHLFAHEVDESGLRRLVSLNNTATKASGHFRHANLTPGSYFLGVTGRPWYAQTVYGQFGYGPGDRGASFDFHGGPVPRPAPRVDSQFDVVYPLTYYPSALDIASASPIPVTEGNETAVQMTLRAVPSIHVRLLGGDSKPETGTNVQVSALGPDGNPIPVNVGAFLQNGQ